MQLQKLIEFTNEYAPYDKKEDWDNVGLLVGDSNREISKVLLTLDITNEVINEAKEKECELIISHHPVIFNPITSLNTKHPVYNLANNDIYALCLHTNLDKAEDGVNITLAKTLNLQNLQKYDDNLFIIGKLEKEMNSEEFASFIKDKLKLGGIKYTKGKNIKSVAVSCGGAGDEVFRLENYEFDAFVTGDMKHHEFLYAKSHNISAYEAGHYNTEHIIIPKLKGILSVQFPNIEFLISETDCDPNQYS